MEIEMCLDSEYPPVPLAYHRYLWIADQCNVIILRLVLVAANLRVYPSVP